MQPFENSAHQAAAADGNDDDIGLRAGLRHLVDEGRMTFPQRRMIERRDVGGSVISRQFARMQIRDIPDITMHGDFSAIQPKKVACLTRCRGRNDHGCRCTQLVGGIRNGEPGIPAG